MIVQHVESRSRYQVIHYLWFNTGHWIWHLREVFQARENGHLNKKKLFELGDVFNASENSRTQEAYLTVSDLIGVAVQDIMIATAIYEYYK